MMINISMELGDENRLAENTDTEREEARAKLHIRRPWELR